MAMNRYGTRAPRSTGAGAKVRSIAALILLILYAESCTSSDRILTGEGSGGVRSTGGAGKGASAEGGADTGAGGSGPADGGPAVGGGSGAGGTSGTSGTGGVSGGTGGSLDASADAS